jgi:NADPH-dependent curcumin reductase CurA
LPKNTIFQLASYPSGVPRSENFRMVEVPIAAPRNGQVLVRARYFSMDPVIRTRIRGEPSFDGVKLFGGPLPIGGIMPGRAAGGVVESSHPDFAAGDAVAGELGWQRYSVVDGKSLRRINQGATPLSAFLGVLGPPGLAAYFAVVDKGAPKPGETIVVSSAAGAVGSLAAQIGKLQGVRVVGIAGGVAKVEYLRTVLGLDEAIDHKTSDLYAAVARTCPNGVDVFLDGVGGAIHDAVMPHINVAARVVLLGVLSSYGAQGDKIDVGPRGLYNLIVKRARMEGFLVGDYAPRFPEGMSALAGWLRDGKIKESCTIVRGFENLPRAFASLFTGEGVIGKLLVQVD